jgi:thioredoxin reductase (NADPH)
VSQTRELVVVGAGPCGIAVGAAAEKVGLDCVLFDKGAIASSLLEYPYYMTFFSTAVMLEVGGVPFAIPNPKPTRQEALAYYRRVVEHWGIEVRQYEGVQSVFPIDGGFRIRSLTMAGDERTTHARAVVIATGGFDRPNMLGVVGEDLPKVRHYYKEPYPYYDQDVAVIGGGNSAVESALELYRNGARVTLVHFGDKIDRGVKPWVVPDITNRLERREIEPRFRTRVTEIRPRSILVRNEVRGEVEELPNDWVLAMTGWRSDPRLLKELGVEIDPHSGIPRHDPETMETNVQDLFIAGVIAAGHNANKIFIENGREHGPQIVEALSERFSRRPAGQL